MSGHRTICAFAAGLALLLGTAAVAASVVPSEIRQPGTQPREVGNLESPDKCDNCHGGYNTAVEPAFNWRGSMMAQAGRDPLFWATLAVVEQDFDGAGDLCIRCHSPEGWVAGRSTPTDGSGLMAGDANGVACDLCHKLTNPDGSEHLGVQNPPFLAYDEASTEGYFGSGMYVLWGGNQKLGPYADAAARHQFMQSRFHRSKYFCATCHDVSNPAVGDLAPTNGRQETSDPIVASYTLGPPVEVKAAFNAFPFAYGVVERTFSEFFSGGLSTTPVASYPSLPADLQAGAIRAAFEAAGGDYADGTARTFTCQTCHMRAVSGPGCNKAGAPVRSDLPLHDMTGGNTFTPDAILHQNAAGTLRLGGGMTGVEIAAVQAGQSRARQQLQLAASLDLSGNVLRVTNLTGHKLITGYPEGRRMWLNVKWYDGAGELLREDGGYGPLDVTLGGVPMTVETILDPSDQNTKIYEAHYAMTQAWAAWLVGIGVSPSLSLGFDRLNGEVDLTLGELAGSPTGTERETFHFVLNDAVAKDNRIPPYGMSWDEARRRNALPVPATQYGDPGPGGVFDHWDELTLSPPAGATFATIDLLYQSTSWEYVQFLYLANERRNAFLADEGANLLDAWRGTGMAKPVVMASATWGTPPTPTCQTPGTPQALSATGGRRLATLAWSAGEPAPQTRHLVYYDQAGKLQLVASVPATTFSYEDRGLSRLTTYCYRVTAFTDCNGNGAVDQGEESAPTEVACATTTR